MRTYLLKRLLVTIPTILGVVTLVFIAIRAIPGDPIDLMLAPDVTGEAREQLAEQLRAQYGFDQPLHIQYVRYLRKMLTLDFGRSIRTRTDIASELLSRFPNTLQLGLLSMVFSLAIGIPLGILSAVRRDTWIDNVAMFGALLGVSMPSFWLGFMLMLAFGLHLRWLPPSGFGGSIFHWDGLKYALMPAFTLGFASAGALARFTRSSMLDVINQDYIRTARAKGLNDRKIVYTHALRNALIPVITLLGIQFGSLLSGAVIVESVFSWPGVGRYLIGGISSRDFPVIQGAVLIVAFGFVLGNLLTDIAYAYVDPRIRYD